MRIYNSSTQYDSKRLRIEVAGRVFKTRPEDLLVLGNAYQLNSLNTLDKPLAVSREKETLWRAYLLQ